MKKSVLKKILKKENKAFKNFYLYASVITFLLIIVIILNVLLNLNEIIPFHAFIVNAVLAFAVAIPFIIIDIKNDKEIKKMYESYQQDSKIPEYKDKTKYLKILLTLSIIVVIIDGFIMAKYTFMKENEKSNTIDESLEIITNQGNVITTQYEDFGEFLLKIPTDFGIMSGEAISNKYPSGNAPSLVYTNERGTINIAFVSNDVAMRNDEIEEYTKLMENMYKEYTSEININFFEKSNHKIGEIKFISSAVDTNIYNHIIAFSVDGKLRLLNFNCTEELRNEWEKVGNFIINSLLFTDNKELIKQNWK